jgi:hypothetical protein
MSNFIETVTVETETIRRIHFDEHTVEVGPHEANNQWMHVRATPDDVSGEYYESLDLSLPPEVALALGKAIVTQATEMLAEQAATA